MRYESSMDLADTELGLLTLVNLPKLRMSQYLHGGFYDQREMASPSDYYSSVTL